MKNDISPAGTWTQVSHMTGRDTHNYTTEDTSQMLLDHNVLIVEMAYMQITWNYVTKIKIWQKGDVAQW